jgi:dienelactone hydrolase
MVKTKLKLSPSLVHRNLVRTTIPTMVFGGSDVGAWQRRLRRRVRDLLCMPEVRPPLRPRNIWVRQHALGTIEKVAFTSEPCSDVPAYVCLPRSVRPPYTCMICLQGHGTGMHNSIALAADESQPADTAAELDFGLWCMRHGMAALCIEMRGLGERVETLQVSEKNKGCPTAAMQGLALGRTLIGERIFDVDRGIDYLAWRGDADMSRIGLMGHSSGGTTAVFAAAVLKRLAFVMPVSYFCTFADSFMARRHCMCCYLPHIMEYAEMADVAGLFAPRPFIAVNGDADELFPIRATRKAFGDLKRIYAAAGTADNCQLVVGKGGHRFFADAAWNKLDKVLKKL